MTYTNYTKGNIYDRSQINVSAENVPTNRLFTAYPNEEHVFEDREGNMSFYQITRAVEQKKQTTLDMTVLSLIATFGTCAMTSRAIDEMLKLLKIEYSKNMLESSMNRLHRYHLINFSHFKKCGEDVLKTRIITLTTYGSQLAKSIGINHRFKALETASMTAAVAKSRAQTAQLIVNYLKNIDVEDFQVRPVYKKNADLGEIVRPAAAIKIGGEYINFEVPRRYDNDWKEEFMGKLNRYKLVFDKMPALIINGEDEAMNLEIHRMLKENGFDYEVLFTDDLAMFGNGFRYSLYSFDEDGNRMNFEIFS